MSLPEEILDYMGKTAETPQCEPPAKSDGAPHLCEALDGGGRVVCFDIGSSGRLGLIRDPAFMLQVLARALQIIGRCEGFGEVLYQRDIYQRYLSVCELPRAGG